MKKTSYELSQAVIDTEGSLREIGQKLGISKAYASMLRKARTSCAAQVEDHWRSGELPWTLVNQLSYLPRKRQLTIMRSYIRSHRKSEPMKVAYDLAIQACREARGIKPDPELEAARQKAKDQHQSDDCQIDTGKVVKVGGEGYWVPAHLWVPVEGIS